MASRVEERDRMKLAVYIAVEKEMQTQYPNDAHKRCLYNARCTASVLKTLTGETWLVQAGDMSWPYRRRTFAGEGNTHFSYVFSDRGASSMRELATEFRRVVNSGVMPEMHCWVANPASHEIVDMTTGYLPKQARETQRIEWEGPHPPMFLWAFFDNLPWGVRYTASPWATMLANLMLKHG